MWAAFAEGDLLRMVSFWDPGISWRAIEGAPDDVGEIRGPEAMARYYLDWSDTFDDLTVALEDMRDLDDGRVLAVHHVTGRAKISGVETETRYAVLYTVRDGKIVSGREYSDLESALRAAGV